MMNAMWKRGIALAMVAALAGGCAARGGDHVVPRPGVAGDTISIAVGPCFGACPVYSVTVTPDGSGLLEPRRFTAVPGETRFTVTVAQYRRLGSSLAAFRPAAGEERRIGHGENCDRFATDMPDYAITWRRGDGKDASLDFQSGCMDARYARLRAALAAMPETLQIEPMLKSKG